MFLDGRELSRRLKEGMYIGKELLVLFKATIPRIHDGTWGIVSAYLKKN
jgi:hypothetical protein